jgi:hypothetical protein
VRGLSTRVRVEEVVSEDPGFALAEPERAQTAGWVFGAQLKPERAEAA